jgi:uncharacterized YccA/Bax inhibitor family protein
MVTMAFNRGNPALNKRYFAPSTGTERMTLDGTIQKTLILIGIVFLAGVAAYSISINSPAAALVFMFGGMFGGLAILAVIIFTRPSEPQILMAIYSLLQGLVVGSVSYFAENQWFVDETGKNEGIILQAVLATIAVFIVMLTLYRFRVIKPTKKFVLAVVSATGALILIGFVSMVMSFFGTPMPFIHNSGPIGIGFSLVGVGLASLFLIIDFGAIEDGVQNGAPKNMEWYGALGLVITLIWLYIELLRLIAKLRD